MKKIIILITIASECFLLQPHAKGQTVAAPYEVATWKNFANAAISYTWDDNTPKQLSVAMPLYDKFGFKVTFFTVLGLNPNWDKLRQADQNGHEVASHSITHTSFNDLTDEAEEKEQSEPQAEINKQLSNKHCVTFAYPFCAVGNTSITDNYYISARGCNGQIELGTPANFMNVGSIGCGANSAVNTLTQFNEKAEDASHAKGWAVFLLHGIDNDGGWSPVESAILTSHLEYVADNPDKFWVDTYGNVVRYIKERNSVTVKDLSFNDSLITLSVTHDLNQEVYNLPLTIKRALPGGWKNSTVTQNGVVLNAEIISEGSTRHIIFNATPNSGNILIARTNIITGSNFENAFSELPLSIYPNPCDSTTKIQFTLRKVSDISLNLLDQSGKRVKGILSGKFEAGPHVYELDLSDLQSDVYYFMLSVNGRVQTKKLLSLK